MSLVDLNYNFECHWLIELSDNNLASELVENRSFLNQSQSRKLQFLWLIQVLARVAETELKFLAEIQSDAKIFLHCHERRGILVCLVRLWRMVKTVWAYEGVPFPQTCGIM